MPELELVAFVASPCTHAQRTVTCNICVGTRGATREAAMLIKALLE